jgi:integrase
MYKRGNSWYSDFWHEGKRYIKNHGKVTKTMANTLETEFRGDVTSGKYIQGVNFNKVKFDELAEDFLRDYRINERKSLNRAIKSVEYLKTQFKGCRVPNITSSEIENYIDQRLKEKAANGTVNRELSALKRILNLGARQTPPKVNRVPYISMLKENNVRKGFFEYAEFLALRENMPEHLKGLCTFAYKTGWRVSEITGLTWGHIDRDNGIVRLEPGEAKNDEGRTVYLDEELKEIFNHQYQNRKSAKKLLPYIFLNESGTDRVKRFDKAFKSACKDAKIGNKLFHDFRRTAVRNMVRSGIPERVAMMISGHKTRSVFDRYNIGNDADLKRAAQMQEAYLQTQKKSVSNKVHKLESQHFSQHAPKITKKRLAETR